jgi:hypothetical protein
MKWGPWQPSWAQRLQTYGRLGLWALVTLGAGDCSLKTATLIVAAGYSYVISFKANQPELCREAQRLLKPLAASQPPEAQMLERAHGQWVRRSPWRTQECGGWLEWSYLCRVWLARTEKFTRQTAPRAGSLPVEVEDHYYISNLPWRRLDSVGIWGGPGSWGEGEQWLSDPGDDASAQGAAYRLACRAAAPMHARVQSPV